MVIPSLISRIFRGESPLKVWGNGKPIRDFVHASDVAKAMIFVMDNNIDKPVNVSSGFPTEIKRVVEIITSHFEDAKFIFSCTSKSKKNVIDPESMIKEYGADAVRWFILSDSPPEKDVQWSNQGVNAAYKFLQKLYNLNILWISKLWAI